MRGIFFRIAIGLIAVISFSQLVFAGAGDPDTSFDGDGKVTIVPNFSIYEVAIQSNGKMVVAGFANNSIDPSKELIVVGRLNANGTMDTTFNKDGLGNIRPGLAIGYEGFVWPVGLIIQSDGRIVLAHHYGLTRFTSDGLKDPGFSVPQPFSDIYVLDAAPQPDGKIVVIGELRSGDNGLLSLGRYNKDGTRDNTFGLNGKVQTLFQSGGQRGDKSMALAIQPDGKIVVVMRGRIAGTGSGSADEVNLTRFNSNGSLDTGFGNCNNVKGLVCPSIDGLNYHSVAIQKNDGKIVIAGVSSGGSIVYRMNNDGTPDTNFGQGGLVKAAGVRYSGIAIQPGGKILVSGYINGLLLITRYCPNDGKLDNGSNCGAGFGSLGTGSTLLSFTPNSVGGTLYYQPITLQNDSKIVVAGGGENGNLTFVTRFTGDCGNGALDIGETCDLSAKGGNVCGGFTPYCKACKCSITP